MITFEAIILSKNKKTCEWKKNLTPEKRALMLKWAFESTAK